MGEVRFMISEAAKKVQVESHVLRYWEEELQIPIGRTEMGHRYYTQDDIQLFCCIKKLKNEGMLLRDLKPLIPELKATRQKLRQTEDSSSGSVSIASTASAKLKPEKAETTAMEAASPTLPADTSASSAVPTEVITETQLEHVRSLIGDVLTEVVTTNNQTLSQCISSQVTTDVTREIDFLLQAKERQEEEHFRRLDNLIRQQQANRRETGKNNPILRLKRMLT